MSVPRGVSLCGLKNSLRLDGGNGVRQDNVGDTSQWELP